jgi:CubicO group peptidase (beta-lactamase class C family)
MFERVALPEQPSDVPWPTDDWTPGELAADVDGDAVGTAIRRMMEQPPEIGLTLGVLVVHRGRLVAEAYGPETTAATTLISWSMAKSVTHALVGLLVGDRLLDVEGPAAVADWSGDPRAAITIQHLLNMRDGLDFTEDYVEAGSSDVIEMLFGSGVHDHAAYAASRPLAHTPGAVCNYSSGTTNIIARIAGDIIAAHFGGAADADARATAVAKFMRRRLFDPLGMSSAEPKFDDAGTFVGSSYLYATARDFAKFGYLYLRDGTWDGARILPTGWVDHARTWTATDPEDGLGYGAHWWLWDDQPGSLACHGYEGQYIIVCPDKDLVVVRLGKSPAELRPAVIEQLRTILDAFPGGGAGTA